MKPLSPILFPAALILVGLTFIQCGRTGKLGAGKYDLADQEFSSQNYSIQRALAGDGGFEEKHVVDHCLLMEMTGKWVQDGGKLSLHYAQRRNRESCHDSLPVWGVDTSALEIPIRNVAGGGYEALLAAADGKPEKWIKWLRSE